MVLCIHSEVTHGDIFEREALFLNEIIKPLVEKFPSLKITLEHISTKDAVDYVLASSDNLKASITCHHLLYNRNSKHPEIRHLLYLYLYSCHPIDTNPIQTVFKCRSLGWRNSTTLVLLAHSES